MYLCGPLAQIVFVFFFQLFLTGHGNHKEDSPFLSSADAAGKKNDFYDRNLALFEVCCFFFFTSQYVHQSLTFTPN